ncbi:MAG: hypothetical protein JW878_01695 [Methanomicrobia archaeon]|nr:hypothetical protein [Methanomicrobia archaeon]
MPLSKSSLTSLTKVKDDCYGKRGATIKPYCTVPAVAIIHDEGDDRKEATTIRYIIKYA